MKTLRTLGAAVLVSGVSTLAMAASNPISVHVLNTQTGTPSSNVEVKLEQQTDNGWVTVATATTSEDGRISALFPEGDTFEPGVYRAVFETGDWYKEQDISTFFPEITVPFEVDNVDQHYHIPLLLSPYAYSTYRGS
ncbi:MULTISPECIES: hydroxyisourate hydrolase [Halomonas]|uniref:hydroxyisourate hydrolase n=1 Tax=Halomonas TaxID=2745 RepID=UPI001C94F7AD|nr:MULTISPECIES: hydroxyisourate hydrolase [Halomonas]MBY5927319.1 hydroxyisourate hydrolase [Halomonas sp. DP4Y7-2]MBY6208346.1 hydroxyisourate hydrolase [Halomonas sp. DP3Y7-2]MBY6229155.1 hydroxyisourate hydrolase [Halomonas sp. DP3Y7-1]MBY6234360.1 hydroxyisourate hydrolase [Halomonas sp. DP4Y7-1]MCA0916862.1 hydroxyisourate hydrolase [Halomonas denitrificans]